MTGAVLFTRDEEYEIDRIRDLSGGYRRKYYVYSGKRTNTEYHRRVLSDFVFFDMKETLYPQHVELFHKNTDRDFFVLKCLHITRIMDRNIDMHQRALSGYKFVIDEHPFLGKRDVHWSYFLWSFFDKSLLGYPHCYSFRDAKVVEGVDPFDCVALARKVAGATISTIGCIYQDDIQVERVKLSDSIHQSYQELKRRLFDTETSPRIIVQKLKRFVNGRELSLKRGLNLLDLNRVYSQYKKGERILRVSDAKVDSYLESEFWKHVSNVNSFMEALAGGVEHQ